MIKYVVKKREIKKLMPDTNSELFEKVWRKYRVMLKSSIDYPKSDADVLRWMENLIGWEVNDSRSRFFITGRPR